MDNKYKNKYNKVEDITDDSIKNYVPYMKQLYQDVVIDFLKEKFNILNIHCVPIIKRIVISSSISNLKHDKALLPKIFNCLYLISGINPIYTKSSRSIAQFKLYKNSVTGCKVVLNKNYVYEFIERLCHIYMPNIKGFRGVNVKSIHKNVLNIGINDSQIMPEVGEFDSMLSFGMTISIIVDNYHSKDAMYWLFRKLDFPIKEDM